MEIADIYVVNKADLPGASRVSRDIRMILSLSPSGPGEWDPSIVPTSVVDGTGFGKLADEIDAHYRFLESNGRLADRKLRIARSELKRAITRRTSLDQPDIRDLVDRVVTQLSNREIVPEDAARTVLRALLHEAPDR